MRAALSRLMCRQRLTRLLSPHSGAHSTQQKLYNWHTLNQKVFKHLGCSVQKLDCERIVNAEPGVIEQVLKMLRARLQLRLEAQYSAPEEPPRSVEPPMRTRVLQSAPAQQQRAPPARQHPLPAEASLALSDVLVAELRDTNQILETKVEKLERLVRLKDAKIAALLHKLNIGEAGAAE